MELTIYVDLRCLQDENYRVRGIGQHVAALLRTREQSPFSTCRAIGLIDPQSGELPGEIVSLVDAVTASVNPCTKGQPAVYIDGTPMTHDPRFSLRFENHPAFLRAAVVYDFIPLEWASDLYLPTLAHRIGYLAKMARLRKFDLFLPISEYTAWRLSERLGICEDRIRVTGASVRPSFYEFRDRALSSSNGTQKPYFMIVIGPDARKNPEVAVKAVRHLNLAYARRIPLKVVGHYQDAHKCNLLSLAGHAEGAGFLEFCPDVSDEELARLYRGATATIVSSHIEGFSLPVVEASVCKCPVIASACTAHLELIEQTEALFPSDDSAGLSERLAKVLHDPMLRASLVASQAHLAAKFHEKAVGQRFWSAIEAATERRRKATIIAQPSKPRLAFMSPYPPDQSGVARYTAMLMRAGEGLFNSDLYTDATRPLICDGNFHDAGPVSIAPLLAGGYNSIISVLGNSHFHTRIFEVFERYGGPCILHDARLIQIYIQRLGQQRFLALATRLVGRPVVMEEVHSWLQSDTPPSLLIEPIVERASPLMVHSVTQQAEIRRRYGVDAQVITSCPTIFFKNEELTLAARAAARNRHGIAPDTFLVSSFGIVAPEKGMDTCIPAVELLRSWHVPAELYFIGGASTHKKELDRIAALYGVSRYIHSEFDFVEDSIYRDFLVASDAALQLRTYGFGQLSAALTDCISAGLACVANSDLAASCDAPAYVSQVPDRFSPLQVAEQLALIWGRGLPGCAANNHGRSAYLKTHNFDYYAKRLVEILGLA